MAQCGLAQSAQATSQPRPPVLVLGLPLHSPGAASRAGTGRGAADPLGELTVLLVLEQSRRDCKAGWQWGVGMGPTSHTSAIGFGSMALPSVTTHGIWTQM